MEEPLQKIFPPGVKEEETASIVHIELKRATSAWREKNQEIHANHTYQTLKRNLGLKVSSDEEEDEEP